MTVPPRVLVATILASIAFAGAGCEAPARRAIPQGELDAVAPERMLDWRFVREDTAILSPELARTRAERVREQLVASGLIDRPIDVLAISGGGADGAYGAGLLNGWTDSSDRPEFTVVTGISTGALTAPFAFLGSDYDASLAPCYTTVDTDSLVTERGFIEGLTGDALASPIGLRALL